jgi:predicted amidohydrolase
MPRFKAAICQFPVSASIERNDGFIKRFTLEAAEAQADVVQFPECALSGYAGSHFKSWERFSWELLLAKTGEIMQLAKDTGIWIILGSSHRLSGGHLPHNSLYVIDRRGRIKTRYDKSFCTPRDLNHFSPGTDRPVFSINRVRCGMAICHDLRYLELYRDYRRRGANCVFNSFLNAGGNKRTVNSVIVIPTMQTQAACNHQWMCVSNSSARNQAWKSSFINPDGTLGQVAVKNRAGLIFGDVDTDAGFLDKCSFRKEAMRGKLHSGKAVRDPRSDDRTTL